MPECLHVMSVIHYAADPSSYDVGIELFAPLPNGEKKKGCPETGHLFEHFRCVQGSRASRQTSW
jgi:hypothetical protein